MAIFLSAGHHKNPAKEDPGAVGSGFQENQLTIEFRDMVLSILKRDYPSYKVIFDDDSETLSQYLSRIQTGNGSVVVEIHFDAFNKKAKGTTALIADKHNQISKELAKELVDITASVLGTSNRGVKTESQSARGKLGFVRKEGATVLMELEFIDNEQAMAGYHEQKHRLAYEFARILTKYDDKVK